MSGLTLKITSMDNAAFADGAAREETVRILREIADAMSTGRDDGVIRDVNGNKVGTWDMELPEEESSDDSLRDR